jgi:hypothetical protein
MFPLLQDKGGEIMGSFWFIGKFEDMIKNISNKIATKLVG